MKDVLCNCILISCSFWLFGFVVTYCTQLVAAFFFLVYFYVITLSHHLQFLKKIFLGMSVEVPVLSYANLSAIQNYSSSFIVCTVTWKDLCVKIWSFVSTLLSYLCLSQTYSPLLGLFLILTWKLFRGRGWFGIQPFVIFLSSGIENYPLPPTPRSPPSLPTPCVLLSTPETRCSHLGCVSFPLLAC